MCSKKPSSAVLYFFDAINRKITRSQLIEQPVGLSEEVMVRLDTVAYGIMVAVLLGPGHSAAQNFPNKPLRIVTAGVGGGNDFASRLIANGLTTRLGQQVVVENRGGASGAIAAKTLVNSEADGYTLLLYSNSIWLIPLLRKNVPWDAFRDFAPLTLAVRSPSVLVVSPKISVHSVRELIALAKAKPGALNYVSGSTGSGSHLSAELLKSIAGVDIVRVNYKGNEGGYNDLLAGNVQVMFASAGGVTPFLKSGRLQGLAVTSAEPTPLFPGLPTMSASGLPGYEWQSSYGMFLPAGTPPALVSRLNQEIVGVIRSAEVKKRFFNSGIEAVGSTPQQLTNTMKAEVASVRKLVETGRITVN